MRKTLEILDSLVAQNVISQYAIGGAVAAIFYTEPVETGDIDVFVAFPSSQLVVSLEPITDALRGLGYTEWDKEGILVEGLPVQFLPAESPLLREALAEAAVHDLGGGACARIMTFEHLCAIMLDTGRPKDSVRLCACWTDSKLNKIGFLNICRRFGLEGKWNAFFSKFLKEPA